MASKGAGTGKWKRKAMYEARAAQARAGDKFMANVERAAKIAEFKYRSDKNTVVWLFDQSSCHKAYAEDALNAKRMNVKPGGAQPHMRDTEWAGKPQKLVDRHGIPKGMRRSVASTQKECLPMTCASYSLTTRTSEKKRPLSSISCPTEVTLYSLYPSSIANSTQ